MEESKKSCSATGNRTYGTLLPLQSDCKARRCLKVRGVGSKGAVLVIMWSLLVSSTVMDPTWERSIDRISNTCFLHNLTLFFIPPAVVVLVGPLAGLLASTYFGRYKTLYTGLWLMWAAKVTMVATFILQNLLSLAWEFIPISLIASICHCLGFTLFLVTAVPFGLDQMPEASVYQIKAFIHWYSWAFFAGFVAVPSLKHTVVVCFDPNLDFVWDDTLLSFMSATLLSATLSSNFLLRGWLIIEPEGNNPLKPFCGILKFAAKHKTPVRRSAFTYWEEDIPSRIDLAKSKYGGPFTNEQVEDVKTCLRMFAVIASIGVTMLAFSAFLMSGMMNLPFQLIGSTYDICYTSANFVGLSGSLLYICVCEVLIHPLIERLFQSILKKVGISLTSLIIASLLFLVSTTVWYTHTTSNTCMFSSEGSLPFLVNPLWIVVPEMVLLFNILFLSHTSILEFICAQSPYILRGMLIGLTYFVCMIAFALGAGVYYVWKSAYQGKGSSSPSCAVWFYLFTTITVTLGCVLWCAVAKWYKRRERDEPEMCRIFAENYYSR